MIEKQNWSHSICCLEPLTSNKPSKKRPCPTTNGNRLGNKIIYMYTNRKNSINSNTELSTKYSAAVFIGSSANVAS